ncbi:MAG: hypothetical protein HC836_40695 [Richelia sp. RM2_1_2]|nr:hypothetical protein [Richelia sp. RM2_1_2]
MFNIVCVKWGTKYGPEYVNNLYMGVKRNLTLPFAFYCFTENSTNLHADIKILPICSDLKLTRPQYDGWWYKLEMFRPNNGLTGQVFYLDLDTVVVGNIDDIVSKTRGFVILRDFYRSVRDPNAGQSSLLAWPAGACDHLYTEFMKDPEGVMRANPGGDQNWMEKQQPNRTYWQDLFPDQVVSFKVHCVDKKDRHTWRNGSILPVNTRVVCFHGPPRPHEVANHDWMRKHWRG